MFSRISCIEISPYRITQTPMIDSGSDLKIVRCNSKFEDIFSTFELERNRTYKTNEKNNNFG